MGVRFLLRRVWPVSPCDRRAEVVRRAACISECVQPRPGGLAYLPPNRLITTVRTKPTIAAAPRRGAQMAAPVRSPNALARRPSSSATAAATMPPSSRIGTRPSAPSGRVAGRNTQPYAIGRATMAAAPNAKATGACNAARPWSVGGADADLTSADGAAPGRAGPARPAARRAGTRFRPGAPRRATRATIASRPVDGLGSAP
jgi:hypothetical protein